MAERRYGFRFSFVEGCVIAASILSGSFLVFLFGVYAGREMESRRIAESARITRVINAPVEALPRSEERPKSVPKDNLQVRNNAPSLPPFSDTERKMPVGVLTPPRPETSLVIPPAVPEKDLPPPPFDTQVTRKVPQPELRTVERATPSQPNVPKTLPPKPATELAKTATPPAPAPFVARSAAPVAASQPPPVIVVPPKPEPMIAKAQKSVAENNAPPAGKRWSVQVYASQAEGEAKRLADQLRGQGHTPVISTVERNGVTWYRVRVGVFASDDEARVSVERFRREGKFPQAYPISN
jgi:DedD protein